jgi:hypothetical protein
MYLSDQLYAPTALPSASDKCQGKSGAGLNQAVSRNVTSDLIIRYKRFRDTNYFHLHFTMKLGVPYGTYQYAVVTLPHY